MDISHITGHSSSMSKQPPAEVFLSFRGQEMRRGFADFLYTMLTDTGIRVLRNEADLERGKDIDPQLIQAIEQCKMSIPIISKEYASSKSCLTELEQMVEYMDNKNHIVIPIFHYVDPSDACNCKGPFERALGEHQQHDRDDSFLNHWISALHRIGELKEYHLHEESEVSHGEIVKQIVYQVQQKLKKKHLIVTKHLVGVDSHVQDIMAKLRVYYRNGQAAEIGDAPEKVLGIYGIPGVGKTVLAKYAYNQLYHLFDACSFLGEIQAEIKRRSIVSVQNKLISDLGKEYAKKFDSSEEALFHIRKKFSTMKVLVLFDDVYDHEQLSALAGDLDWLGPRSRVMLTSQTQDTHRNINGAKTLVLEPMKQDEALKLFCRHAFGTDSPWAEFKKLSTDIVAATAGLPLTLEVIGSSLYLVKSKKAWRETLTALNVAPHRRVQAALEKSYTCLDENEQQIFLDIACFFIGMDKRIPYYMWDDCKYSPSRSIRALRARSMIDIGEDKELLMHEILKKFGHEIVKNENRHEPFKRSRLWDHEEALHVLEKREGTDKIEALGLKCGYGSKGNISFKCDQFDGLHNLRFLKLDRADIQGKFGDRLLNLRWLDWQWCPTSFYHQALHLNVQNLVILDLSRSWVDEDWKGWKVLEEAKKLKVLKLSGCLHLKRTPPFPPSMELERLILEDCYNLIAIHPSVSNLEKLVSLNIKQCDSLYELPDLGPMRVLEELMIDGTSISRINLHSMVKLRTLGARNCTNLIISDQIGYPKSLKYLHLEGTKVDTLPESIRSLEQLKTLSLKKCRRLDYLPDAIGSLSSLQFLDLSETGINTLPDSIISLEKLNMLSLENCRMLSNLPHGIGKLRPLQFLDLSYTSIDELPASIEHLKALKVLRMRCTSIRVFPEAILNLEKLEEIDFSICRNLEGRIPDDICRLSSLQILKLSLTRISGLPESISCLSRLRELDIWGCGELQKLPALPASLINVPLDLGK